ncbi:thioesterase family protein [Cognatishimia activa]|uniref:thioesterase family protein n=1 Tax=Cognatishimia activa TaxID=1715691 RepID=UPI0022313E2E|nr:thioesterase family protein [Cognatishimia activa]UZD91279.1 thioesterase family protein [Cognatishimia activa]
MNANQRQPSGYLTFEQLVPANWLDFNGHMNEARYTEAGARATDKFLEIVGADEVYVRQGRSYFTTETHVRYLSEVHLGSRLQVFTKIVSAGPKSLHLMHRVIADELLEQPAAKIETLLLHVEMQTRKVSQVSDTVRNQIESLLREQGGPDNDPCIGRYLGQR